MSSEAQPSASAEAAFRVLCAAAQEEMGHTSSPAWQDYLRGLEGLSDTGSLSLRTVREWARKMPASANPTLVELRSLFQEGQEEILAESALALARRLTTNGSQPLLLQELLGLAQSHELTRTRAETLLLAIRGEGSFAHRMEYQAPRLLRELGSPIALGSFGLAGLAARGSSFLVLARAERLNLSALLLSESAALATEVSTLVVSRRAATQWFAGERGLLTPSGIRDEMFRTVGPFALLRLMGNGFAVASPALSRNRLLSDGAGRFNSFGRTLHGGVRFSADLAAVLAGHSLNAYWGLETLQGDGWDRLFNGALTVAHLRLAGNLIDRSGLFRMPAAWEAQRSRLLHEIFSPSDGPRGPVRTPIEFGPNFGKASVALVAAAPGSRIAAPKVPAQDWISLMTQSGEGGSSGNKPPTPGAPARDPGRTELAKDLARQKLDEYINASNGQDTLLTRAANLAKSLITRGSEKSDPPTPEGTRSRISQVEEAIDSELQRHEVNQPAVRSMLEDLQVFLRRIMPEEVADSEVEPLLKQEEERSKIATAIRSFLVVWRIIRKQGSNEQRQQRLDAAMGRLKEIFPNLPGVKTLINYRQQQNLLSDRRSGALLGLAVRPELGVYDSPFAREKRGETWPGDRPDEIELELLHRALHAFGQSKPKTKNLAKSLEQIAGEYHASPSSRAAMILYGEALHALAYRNFSIPELLRYLNQHPDRAPLQEQLSAIDSLRDSEGDPGEGLDLVGVDPTAADFFATGLLTLVRSQGDPQMLVRWLRAAEDLELKGFHPSIPVSLFGAAHGREKLPDDLLLVDAVQEDLLKRFDDD